MDPSQRQRIESLDNFWIRQFAVYLSEHRNPANRLTHIIGIPLLITTAIASILRLDWRMFVGGQIVGWAIQLLGHRIEGNRPALVKNPTAFVMGPFMVLVEIAEFVGIHFEFAEQAREVVLPK